MPIIKIDLSSAFTTWPTETLNFESLKKPSKQLISLDDLEFDAEEKESLDDLSLFDSNSNHSTADSVSQIDCKK
jgi:hypothetical protein